MPRTGDNNLLSIGKPRPTEQTTPAFLRALQDHPLCKSNQVVITCYHASVAQKSYGGEKRFLCPPPAVLIANAGSGHLCNGTRSSSSAHAPLECQTSFNERNVALFKSLHVTGMQKAKCFRLHLDLLAPSGASRQLCNHDQKPWQAPGAYASLESDPVAIISKPSKKTAKARNQSSCIREGSLISLFNRINSQTFRTKYLNVDHRTNRWVAQSHNWSPLEVVVVATRENSAPPRHAAPVNQPGSLGSRPLYYGSEIVLVESRRNFRSPPMIIHKVERGRLIENASSPVSQMQKIALQL
ncbi:p53-like transcription factor, partial [Coemansia reversa NRRL 1564]